MLLYEFTGVDPTLIQLVAVIGQLKSSIESGDETPDWTVDSLLDYLKDNEIIIDKADLFNMVKNPPLNNAIENIQGDNIIFKGQSGALPAATADVDQNKKIVKQMAHNAAK